jgi:hypothetical protein
VRVRRPRGPVLKKPQFCPGHRPACFFDEEQMRAHTTSPASPVEGLPLSDLIIARDVARAADRAFQAIVFDILTIGRDVKYLRDGVVRTGRIVEHGTKGEWWYWTMVWVRDDAMGKKIAINVVDVISAIKLSTAASAEARPS